MILHNPLALRTSYPAELARIMNIHRTHESRLWLSCWDQLLQTETPLWQLPGLAGRLGVGELLIKDESVRSPLGSFKALGAPIALVRLAMRLFPEQGLIARRLLAGDYREQFRRFTVISATDGNHGRALAAAARSMGCRCVIVLHAQVSMEREAAITAYGAQIVRIRGNYDDSVHEAARLATENDWQLVSDTSFEGYEDVARDVMQGYSIIAAEIVQQIKDQGVTHVFLQGGVGGLAAGVASYLWELFGSQRPIFVVVEPCQADCLYQSALTGQAAKASGSVDSVMAGLACGETSVLAWRFLQSSIDWFMTVDDAHAVQAMRVLATGDAGDLPVVAGESGVAGLAGLMVLAQNQQWFERIGLGKRARVLLINTEGDTAPGVYEDLVGESGHTVRRRQLAWLGQTD